MTLRRALRWLAVLVAVAVAFGLGAGWSVLVRPPLVVGQDAVSDPATAAVEPRLEDAGGRVLLVRPAAGTADRDVLVVLYPGGLVRPQAYEWLGRELALDGYTTVIPEFSFDLAVTDADRAAVLIERYGPDSTVVLAGHSLGGAMAAQFVADEVEAGRQRVDGLILMAAYPPEGADLSETTLAALTLRAENDGVADAAQVSGGLDRLPSGATEVVVPGAVHSFFGRYGPQSGDGVPTVSRAEAEATILTAIEGFLGELG